MSISENLDSEKAKTPLTDAEKTQAAKALSKLGLTVEFSATTTLADVIIASKALLKQRQLDYKKKPK